jgi:hypothetical protein
MLAYLQWASLAVVTADIEQFCSRLGVVSRPECHVPLRIESRLVPRGLWRPMTPVHDERNVPQTVEKARNTQFYTSANHEQRPIHNDIGG